MQPKSQLLTLSLVLSSTLFACGTSPEGEIDTTTGALTTVISELRGYTKKNGHRGVVYVTSNQNVAESAGPPGARTFTNLGGFSRTFPSPRGIVRTDNVDAIYYVNGTDDHMHEVVNGQDIDMYSAIGAPAVERLTDFAPHARSDNRTALYYIRKGDRHVIELASNFGSSPPWIVTDLTNFTSSPPADAFEAFAYLRSDNKDAVIYRSDRKLYEIASNFGSSPAWLSSNLMVAAGIGSVNVSHPPLAAYKRSDNRNAVVFQSSIGTIYEISNAPGTVCPGTANPWCSTVIRSPFAASGISAFVRWDGLNSVVMAANGGLLVMVQTAGGTWEESWISASVFGFPFAERAPSGLNSILIPSSSQGSGKGYEFVQMNGMPSWVQTTL